ncbi:phage tail protein [Riemerella anatipestifer]|uniref:phage tail protein n=1 Tax=Riemerella anatipestifer TaxID=34085 RepID=UPI001C6EE47B|nr:phage tail protein [Riemerella anatipestifer]QYR03383.1 phage tail protein [Riemerella anatipestifer]
MEFIVVQGDKTLNLNNRKPLCSVAKAEHRQSLLSEDVINITIESKTPLALQVGNYIEYENRRYTLNSAPKVKKEQGYYTYDLVFEGVQYLLRDKVYFNLDAQGFQNTADFPLTGEINIFLTTLITNINSISDFTWVLGEYPQNTETKTLTFNNENCLAVLQKICQEYDTEFEIKQDLERKSYTLNIKKIGETLNQTFEYGKGNGLYSLSRENANDNVVTRLYVFGSTNNIKSGYRDYSQRLRLPISHGKDYIQDDNKVSLFGLKEGVKNFDDIKPTFKGIVSGVTNLENGSQEIEVSNMDFDLNETDSNGTKYLLNDTPAKLHINKGNLAGYEFELLKNGGYNHATKTFRVKQFTDERGQKFPEAGSVFSFAVGDEFTLLDIAMPEQYITNAENKLLEEGQKEYEKQSVNNLKYNLELDPLYLQQIGANTSIFFKIGDYIRVIDEPLKIDKTTRIVDITRDLLDEYNYKIGIADTYEISFVASLLTDIKDTKTVIKTQEQINRRNYLNGYRNQKELQESIFDVDGNLDLTKIRHHSISANMLSTGALGYRIALENGNINPNIEGNPARTFVSGGKIVEFSLEDDIREWNILPYSRNDLLNQVYYVYAKCSRGNGMGVWYITTEQIKFDSRSDYYYFLCYLLYTPKDGKREAESMHGNVFMHGGQITAGRIKSLNGQTYFDLDSGEIAGTIKYRSSTGTYEDVGNAITLLNNANANLGTMAWQNSVERAMLGNTIVQGGYIKTELLNASAIVSNGGGATTAQLNNAINSIIIGGRNLILNSKGSFSGRTDIYGGVGWFIFSEPLKQGESYVFTYKNDIAYPHAIIRELTLRDSEGNVVDSVFPNENNEFRFVAKANNIVKCYLYADWKNAYYGFSNLKLEKGNRATDWTPAPEDIETQFANLQQGISNMQTSLSDVKNKTDNFSSIQGGLMMANLMSVGSNQANQNAFISGITDEGAMSVRFGAGSNYANKHNAPFRVLDNGKMIAKDADITGKINATGGKIGAFEIIGDRLSASTSMNNDSWEPRSSYSLISPEMILFRQNGESSIYVKEAGFGITQSVSTGEVGAMGFVKNNINNPYRENTALRLQAKHGQSNIALDILDGDIRVGGEIGYTGLVFLGNRLVSIKNGIIVKV